MDSGWDSGIIGELASASGLEPANGWERGVTRGGGRTTRVGGATSITTTSVSIISTSIITGNQASCIASITMDSTRGMGGSGRIIGVLTSTRTRAVPSITTVSHG